MMPAPLLLLLLLLHDHLTDAVVRPYSSKITRDRAV
jgi:hypothetical protein